MIRFKNLNETIIKQRKQAKTERRGNELKQKGNRDKTERDMKRKEDRREKIENKMKRNEDRKEKTEKKE